MTQTTLETGTYEIIRNRLLNQGTELRNRLGKLNEERKKVFGAIETQLIANDRISTANFCIARDIVAIGDTCIFGYNVHIGLRSGTKLSDVFSIYQFENGGFHQYDLNVLENEQFAIDFENLYRYYKETHFAKFAVIGTYLYMVFQVSKNVNDIKAFKWLINGDKLDYVDGRSEHEFRFPQQHEFSWQRVTRDMHRFGKHPHVSILDTIFVETVGGDLTIKVEDNTDDGKGIYNEAVEYQDQTLDDAEYAFADLGNLIALRIKPYQEAERYFIFNNKMQTVERIDTLAEAAVMLPDNHGIIFSNGYYLQSGEYKIFDVERRGKLFERRIASPNGEDVLYVFYSKTHGRYVLMSYNVISQTVATPIVCHGYTVFPNGELAYFRAEEEQTKHHVVQIWQTPFITGDIIPSEHTDSYLYKVGNKDIVRAMAECSEVMTLLNKDDSFSGLYLDLVKKTSDILDSYYWIDKAEAYKIHEPLGEIRASA
ncbi:MAG: DNA repair ATPase, partial [Saprospiraceae bacterium]